MNSSFPSNPFGGAGFGNARFGGPGFGGAASAMFEAMEHVRKSFDPRPGGSTRVARGDVRASVLALLAEKPMHGYQIITEIAERSGGAWKPSAGSVYPTLQLLADEGLIEAEEQNGRKTYSLTEAGRAVAEESGETPAPWETSASNEERQADPRFGALPKAGVDLAAAIAQVGRAGTAEQVDQCIEVLDEARRKLYSILAEN